MTTAQPFTCGNCGTAQVDLYHPVPCCEAHLALPGPPLTPEQALKCEATAALDLGIAKCEAWVTHLKARAQEIEDTPGYWRRDRLIGTSGWNDDWLDPEVYRNRSQVVQLLHDRALAVREAVDGLMLE